MTRSPSRPPDLSSAGPRTARVADVVQWNSSRDRRGREFDGPAATVQNDPGRR